MASAMQMAEPMTLMQPRMLHEAGGWKEKTMRERCVSHAWLCCSKGQNNALSASLMSARGLMLAGSSTRALGAAITGPRTARVEMMVVNFMLMECW